MKTKFSKLTKEEKKQIGRRKPFRNLLIVSLVGIFTGVAVGLYFNSNRLDPNRYNYEVSTLVDDVDAIRRESLYKNQLELGATKCCVLAFDTTFNYPKVYMTGKGVIKASVFGLSVDQTIDSRTIRINDKLLVESISVSSFVKALNRSYVDDGNILHYSGNLSDNTVVWNTTADNTDEDDIKTMSDYKSRYGCTMFEYMTYIVSSKTVVSETQVTQDENGNFVFTLVVDKSKSVVNYVKTMKDTGGLSEYPNFKSDPKLTLVIDSQYRILEFKSSETYSANVGISANSVGTLTNTFQYDGDFSIPPITENTQI